MASARYTWNLKPEDLAPPPPPPPMTPEEKRKNFWHYYKGYFIIGGIALAILALMIHDVVTQVRPDYEIGLITTIGYPPDTDAVLAEHLAPFFDDRNGDGQTVVNVNIYSMAQLESTDFDPNVQVANQTKLVGDISAGESMLFLTDRPSQLDAQYGLFSDGGGTAEGINLHYDPADDEKYGVRWGDCPQLTALELGESSDPFGGPSYSYQLYLADFRLVPRVFENTQLAGDEKARAYYEASVSAMEKMIG